MPKSKKATERYQRINDIMTRRTGEQSIVKLKDLAAELEISERQLREDFYYLQGKGAPLEYVPAQYGWRYTPDEKFTIIDQLALTSEDVLYMRIAMETLSRAGQLKNLEQASAAFGKIQKAVRSWVKPGSVEKAIYFDPLPEYGGSKHLTFMLSAIDESRRVEFNYQGYHAPKPKKVLFDPWFLRHYDRRWYVGGFSHDPNEGFVRTFPLERIKGIPKNVGYCHNEARSYDAQTYWQHIYGITIPRGGVVEEVEIKFFRPQSRYFLDTPFFTPFEVLEETADFARILFRIIPNIDLQRKLASLGGEVQVLRPKSLAAAVGEMHRAALSIYK